MSRFGAIGTFAAATFLAAGFLVGCYTAQYPIPWGEPPRRGDGSAVPAPSETNAGRGIFIMGTNGIVTNNVGGPWR